MGRRGGEEDDLVRSACRGESWALTAVWHRYSPVVLAYLRGRGIRDAEDLTSEVFLQVFRRIESFRGDAADLRTFVFSVAHARYVDEQRKLARRGTDAEFIVEDHEQRAPSAEAEALDTLGTERVRMVLEALAPDQRDVLLLRIVADLSLEQTAELLGKSVGAVKSLQHRALAALRPVLGEAVSP